VTTVTLVYCGQMVGWNGSRTQDARYGGRRSLGPGDIVLVGDPASPTERGTAAPFPPLFGPCLLRPNGRPYQQLLSSCYPTAQQPLATFRVRRSRGEMYINWPRPSVCLSVPRRIPTLLHGPGCNLGEWQGYPCVLSGVANRCTGFVAMTTYCRMRNVSACLYSHRSMPDFVLFRLISLLLYNFQFHGAHLFSARGAILLIELVSSMP